MSANPCLAPSVHKQFMLAGEVAEKFYEPIFLLCTEAVPDGEIDDAYNFLGTGDLGLGNGRGHGQLLC